jgi:hypothetical protein
VKPTVPTHLVDIKEEESALCADNGIEFGPVTVANDALSVIVNQDNPLQCISVESLKALWELTHSSPPGATSPDSTPVTWLPKMLFSTAREPTPEPSTSSPRKSTVRVATSAPTTTTSVRTTTRLFRVSPVARCHGLHPLLLLPGVLDTVKGLAIDGGAAVLTPPWRTCSPVTTPRWVVVSSCSPLPPRWSAPRFSRSTTS